MRLYDAKSTMSCSDCGPWRFPHTPLLSRNWQQLQDQLLKSGRACFRPNDRSIPWTLAPQLPFLPRKNITLLDKEYSDILPKTGSALGVPCQRAAYPPSEAKPDCSAASLGALRRQHVSTAESLSWSLWIQCIHVLVRHLYLRCAYS